MPAAQEQVGFPLTIVHEFWLIPVQGLGEQAETHFPAMQDSPALGQVPLGFELPHSVLLQGGRWHMPPETSFDGLLQIVPAKQSALELHFFWTQ